MNVSLANTTKHALLAIAIALTAGFAGATDIAKVGELTCTLAGGGKHASWQVQLDDAVPLALVDGQDLPADYSSAHIQIRLAIDGPTLTIGRSTGRIVASSVDGVTLGKGFCLPIQYVAAPAKVALPPISRSNRAG